ncbi:MAG: hypothetical protein AB8G86_04850 [Saprospiraceae bacterium]
MAKKNFKGNLGGREYLNVINTGKDEKEEDKKEKPVKDKSAKPNYKPHTLKIREDIWTASQALAWWERGSFQGFFTKVLESHIESLDPRELNDIIEKYNKHKNK